MRAIQSARISPLRCLRSRYAYASECMTASLAGLYSLRRAPCIPSARSRLFLWRALPVTPRFTLAMVSPYKYGARRMTILRPADDTSWSLRYSRLRLLLLCSSRCERNDLRRITFPVAVTRKRFFAPLCCRIFGIVGVSCLGGFAIHLNYGGFVPRRGPIVVALVTPGMLFVERAHDHDHVPALDEWH